MKQEQQEPVENVDGVRVDGLLRGLGWVERQLSSSDNIHLLHAFSDCHQIDHTNTRSRKTLLFYILSAETLFFRQLFLVLFVLTV